MITRRILVTTIVKGDMERKVYGRFDAVALAAAGWKIKESEFQHFKMSEDIFVDNATRVYTGKEE